MRKLMIIIVAVAVSGCVTKPYKTPQTSHLMDSLYRVLENRVDTVKNEADVSWMEFFTDPILIAYITEALENNMDMQVAVKNIGKANAQFRSARAAFYPSANGSIGYGINMQDGAKMVESDQINLKLGWEIDVWGKISSAKRAAYATLLQQEDVRQLLQTNIIQQIASMYYNLVAYDAQMKVITDAIANRKDYLVKIRWMKDNAYAKVNEVAVQQGIAQLAEVQAALPSIQLAIIQTENAFRLLLGRSSGYIERHPVIDITGAKLVTDIGYPAQLLVNRPDVRAAENEYRAAHEMWNVSRAAMYPSLTISAEGSITDVTNSHFGILNVLGGLTQPIFNARKLRAQRESAKLSAEQAEINFRKAILTAGMEVSNALAKQLKTKEIAIAKVVQLRALRKSYDDSMDLFSSGYATYLDVLVAQTGVYNTETSLINTYLDNLVARIELYRALGGGAKTK